jgi:lipid-A-disaccharide synthase-like uncharacterized protein
MDGTAHVVGWVAVVLTQVFYVPNTVRILKTRNVAGYSLAGWLMLTLGLGCYLLYFAVQGDVVGIVANVCGVFGSGLTTACILLWRNPPAEARAKGSRAPLRR